MDRLIAAAGDGATGYAGYLTALENRRRYFVDHGAVSADHGVRTPATLKLDAGDAARLFDRARSGQATAQDRDDFEAHMMYQMARMSVEDGLVMTIHPGPTATTTNPRSRRSAPTPATTSRSRSTTPRRSARCCRTSARAKDFHLVLFTLDETVFSRELAPLAGFYPSVYLGAPWWFLDAPDAMLRFRSAVTETAGFSRSSGFIDDTRAFCSIPARHDASRRIEASFLARLVAEHRVSEDRAHELIVDLVDALPPKGLQTVSTELTSAAEAERESAANFPSSTAACAPSAKAAGADRPPGPGRLPPLAPGLVHPPGAATPRTGASPPSPAAAPTPPLALAEQDGLYTVVERADSGDSFASSAASWRPWTAPTCSGSRSWSQPPPPP